MNMVSYNVISTYKQGNAILTCHMLMVSVYLSKYFVVVEANINELKDIPIEVKTIFHAINKHPNNSVLSFKRRIPPYCNNMTKIYLHPNI